MSKNNDNKLFIKDRRKYGKFIRSCKSYLEENGIDTSMMLEDEIIDKYHSMLTEELSELEEEISDVEEAIVDEEAETEEQPETEEVQETEDIQRQKKFKRQRK